MAEEKHCPECGADLTLHADAGDLCPDCLSRLASRGADSVTVPLGQDEDETWTQPPSGALSEWIGGYYLVGVISSGGMGVVYEAIQEHPRRTVALKVMRHSIVSGASLRRFEHEFQILARLRHANIARVIEAGTHAEGDISSGEAAPGAPYFVMEYIPQAQPITCYAGKKRLNVRQRLGLFLQVCDGVHHGHQKGIIHRDLKPANILVDGSGQVKIIDFGVARITDPDLTVATQLTEAGQLVGTVQYMSPEQCQADPLALDMRSDVYALGVVLYELLCEELPYNLSDTPVFEATRVIREVAPKRPSTVRKGLGGDLEIIVLKAMEKELVDRYQSTADLADDIRRFIRGEVIQARPAGPLGRFGKWIRRKPRLSAAVGVATLAMAGFLGHALLWSYPRLQAAYGQIVRLSDIKRVSNLEEQAERLWPAHPENLPEMQTWIDEAQAVIARLDDHRQRLDALRRQGRFHQSEAARGESPVYGTWAFDDVETKWQHDVLVDLVSRLESLGDPERGALRSVRERLVFASTIGRRSIEDHREEWEQAIASIANLDECPMYDGLPVTPQMGLVPVGRDPSSGLWEFVHLQTGAIPLRDADGTLELTEDMGLVFVLLPGGTFRMGAMLPSAEHPLGAPNVDSRRYPWEEPVHRATVGPFLMSKYEMTRGQWHRATGVSPEEVDPGIIDLYRSNWNGNEDLQPSRLFMAGVSWEECTETLSRMGLRLPSEAEWEYAARAGTTTVWWTGDDPESRGHTGWTPVGVRPSNPFGIHDVSNNVLEWCQDDFHTYTEEPVDGTAFKHSESISRIVRGRTSAWRGFNRPSHRDHRFGVRPAASLRR